MALLNPIILMGSGGHCRACIDVVEASGLYTIVGVITATASDGESVLGYPVIGNDDNLPSLISTHRNALIAVGQIQSASIRLKLYDQLKSFGAVLPTIISPLAYRSRHSEIGNGNIVMHGAIINAGAVITDNCIINSMALIEHDVVVESHCHIATGAKLNGAVNIGSGSFVGSGAVIKQGVRLGKRVVVGAGQIVMKDIPDDVIVKGNKH